VNPGFLVKVPPVNRLNRNDQSRSGAIATLVTAVATLVVYLATLAPSVVGGDAGELVAAVAGGGVPHPPGYPLYALLGRLFTWLPIGEPALRMNLFSMAAGIGAAVMLQRAAARWSGSPWAGVLAAACFAFSPVVWEHSVGAEVFALHHVFVAALLWVAVIYAETAEPRWVWLGAGLAALGMSHHHTLVFFALPLAAWPLLRQPSYWLKPARLAGLAGVGLAGLLPYLWLPFATMAAAPVSWGDCTTLPGFWTHFTRAEYGSLQLAAGEVATSGGWTGRLAAWWVFQGGSLAWIGLALALSGLVISIRSPKWRTLGIGSAATLGFYVLTFNYLANLSPETPLIRSVLLRFWTMPHLLVCAWLAVGWAHWTRNRKWIHPWGTLVLALLPIAANWRTADRRNAREFADYGAVWLESLPQGAVLLARGDLVVNTLNYRQHCTGLRPDVRVLDLERMTYPWHARTLDHAQPDLVLPAARYHLQASDGYDLRNLIEANPELGPWFVAGDLSARELARLPGWKQIPHGTGWRLLSPSEAFDFETWWQQSETLLPKAPMPSPQRRKADPWAAAVAADFIEARHRRGVKALETAMEQNNAAGPLRKAIAVFEEITGGEDAPALVFKNLGIAWQRMEKHDPARSTARAKAAWQRYLEIEDGTDRDAAVIRQWLHAN
jgi:hypothetical protein